jgi:hypothetical protein
MPAALSHKKLGHCGRGFSLDAFDLLKEIVSLLLVYHHRPRFLPLSDCS